MVFRARGGRARRWGYNVAMPAELAPDQVRLLFELDDDEHLPPWSTVVAPATLDFAAVVSRGRHVGPYRLRGSRWISSWAPDIGHLALSEDGRTLAYATRDERGWTLRAGERA